MSDSEEIKITQAAAAGAAEIAAYVHDPSARVVRALLQNRNILEEDVLIIANRKNISPDILDAIAKDKRWSESYPLRLALARNPKSPLSVSLSTARFLRLFDLEEITRNHTVPLVFRHKIESMISERIPTMPLGNKKSLAKKAAGTVLLKLLLDGDPEIVKLCLANPHLTEAHLFKVISRPDASARTLTMIAGHRAWSIRALIQRSLVRNAATPISIAAGFLPTMTIVDLRELHTDPSLPVTVRPFIHRELLRRGVDPMQAMQEKVFEIDEDEMAQLETEPELPEVDEHGGEKQE